eukprot:6332742-Alexandrium_andersonii.AAC.1
MPAGSSCPSKSTRLSAGAGETEPRASHRPRWLAGVTCEDVTSRDLSGDMSPRTSRGASTRVGVPAAGLSPALLTLEMASMPPADAAGAAEPESLIRV